MEKKLDGNYTRMLQAILNKSWKQHPTKPQLYGHLPLITKTIKVRRTFISDVLLWTPSHGRAKAGRPARTYLQQFCEDTGCSPEDQPEAMTNREEWRERVRDIRAGGTTRWWCDDECHKELVRYLVTLELKSSRLYSIGKHSFQLLLTQNHCRPSLIDIVKSRHRFWGHQKIINVVRHYASFFFAIYPSWSNSYLTISWV